MQQTKTCQSKWYLPVSKNHCCNWIATALEGLFGKYHSSSVTLVHEWSVTLKTAVVLITASFEAEESCSCRSGDFYISFLLNGIICFTFLLCPSWDQMAPPLLRPSWDLMAFLFHMVDINCILHNEGMIRLRQLSSGDNLCNQNAARSYIYVLFFLQILLPTMILSFQE